MHFCLSPCSDQRVALSMTAFAQLRELQFQPASATVHVGASLQLELHLCSLMPVPVQLEQLAASVHFIEEQPGSRSGPAGTQRRPGLNPDGSISFPAVSPSGGVLPGAGMPALELYEMQDRSPSDNMLNSTGVICKNSHMVLCGSDGSPPLDVHSSVGSAFTMEDGTQVLKTNNVTLLPGNNSIVFTALVREAAQVHLKNMDNNNCWAPEWRNDKAFALSPGGREFE